MRILAFSDLHRDRARAEQIVAMSSEADVVIGAGDFATKGFGLDDTIGVLKQMAVPMLLVAGNHESVQALTGACAGWNSGMVLHAETRSITGVPFFGLGYEVSTVARGRWNQQMSEDQAAASLARCPANAVLVTHSPPYGVADIQADGTYDGSRSIRAAIEAKLPRLHVCGHVHHSWGCSGMISTCPVHNIGPEPRWFVV